MVFKLISCNWYSILSNGQACGFFQSSRGVKQGDLLSPTLFILAAEVLTRGLNDLRNQKNYKGYGLHKWSTPINNLAYADNTILFSTADEKSMKMMIKVIRRCESISSQFINLNISAFMFMI